MQRVLPLFFIFLSLTVWGQNRERRNVPGFVMITFRLPGTLVLKQGTERSVEVEAPPGVMSKIVTRVSAGRLIIEPEKIDSRTFHQDFDYVKIHVTTIQLEDLHMNGSGKAICEGVFDLEKITFNLSGSGSATMEMTADSVLTTITGSGHLDLKGKVFYSHNNISGSGRTNLDVSVENKLHADISGSGELDIKGSGNKLDLIVAGSGKCQAFDFPVNDATISITGGAQVDVNVNKSLETEIHGKGVVRYKGNPEKVGGHGSRQAVKAE